MISALLKRITESLEDKSIPYMLSGSIALNYYAVPRMTLDIDIVVELNEINLSDFFSIFDESYYINKDTAKEEIARSGMFNVIDHSTGFKVDFIVRKKTLYRDLEFRRRKKNQIGDLDVWIVTPEDLIISKIAWIQQLQSDKQMEDIKNLLAIPGIDRNYIRNWCKELNLNTYNLLGNA
jgi:hypothetical protein